MLLGALGASLLGNLLTEKDYIELEKECTKVVTECAELEKECTEQVKD